MTATAVRPMPSPAVPRSPRRFQRVVVLGANGTMGYRCGALFAGAGSETVFLARTRDKAIDGRAGAIKAVRSSTLGEMILTGSYDEDFDAHVADADLIFEAVAEDAGVKNELFERVDRLRREDAIVASVTSGLSINGLAAPRSDSFKRHFLGLHFFNPPQVIVGTEIVAGRATDPAVVDFVDDFCAGELGRVTIRTADTPGFAGNRVGFKVMNEVAQLAEEHGPLLMDRLVGPYTGRAMTPLATIDLVGWDVHRAIVDNVYANTKDKAHETLKLPAYMERLIQKGVLGAKSEGGFFKRDGKTAFALDPATGDYRPVKEIKLPDLKFIDEIAFLHRIGDYKAAMARFVAAKGEYAKLARRVVAGYIAYAFHRVGEVTETITGIDLIMGTGFNWAPPSALVDTMGASATARMTEEAGLRVPKAIEQAAREKRTAPFFSDPRIQVGKFFVAK